MRGKYNQTIVCVVKSSYSIQLMHLSFSIFTSIFVMKELDKSESVYNKIIIVLTRGTMVRSD